MEVMFYVSNVTLLASLVLGVRHPALNAIQPSTEI